jgi:hypothetical protein
VNWGSFFGVDYLGSVFGSGSFVLSPKSVRKYSSLKQDKAAFSTMFSDNMLVKEGEAVELVVTRDMSYF